MAADDTGDRLETEPSRLMLVHDAESTARNLADTGDPPSAPERCTTEERAEKLINGLAAPRFPAQIPSLPTTNRHRNAVYSTTTDPAPRTDTPPVQPATIIDITDPGQPLLEEGELLRKEGLPPSDDAIPTLETPIEAIPALASSRGHAEDQRHIETVVLKRGPRWGDHTVPGRTSARRRLIPIAVAACVACVALLLLAAIKHIVAGRSIDPVAVPPAAAAAAPSTVVSIASHVPPAALNATVSVPSPISSASSAKPTKPVARPSPGRPNSEPVKRTPRPAAAAVPPPAPTSKVLERDNE